MRDEFSAYDAVGLSELVRKGEVQPAELVEAVIQRIELVNPKLNAVILKMYDEAREVAKREYAGSARSRRAGRGFGGVPFLLKDVLAEYQGTPFHEGSRGIKGYVSKIDSELVRRQKAGGLIIVGKTNTPEFAQLPTTEPQLTGPTANPWNPALMAGGSSGGAAAAVASRIVPMAHGNDGGGSIRIPASCCGVFGLKPTRARNPVGPLFGDGLSTLACEHALTRTVRDSAALLDVTSGPELGDPYWAPPRERMYLKEVNRDPGRLKIGFLLSVPEGWNDETGFDPDCEAAVRDAARLCGELGHEVEEIAPKDLSYPELYRVFGSLWVCLLGRFVAYWEAELGKKLTQDQLEPTTWAAYQLGLKRTGADYLGALERAQRFSRKLARWYHEGGYDMLLTPTMRIRPTRLGSFEPSPDDPLRVARLARAFGAFTSVCNMTGQPAMSVPLYWSQDNIPIGVQFAARFGDEGGLFRLAAQLERARPWADRKPPVHCARPL
jgi:amidase